MKKIFVLLALIFLVTGCNNMPNNNLEKVISLFNETKDYNLMSLSHDKNIKIKQNILGVNGK